MPAPFLVATAAAAAPSFSMRERSGAARGRRTRRLVRRRVAIANRPVRTLPHARRISPRRAFHFDIHNV
ncbi:hypothetical protein AQ956_17055 [Burkholderia pseudomallei]|nr:hypothetical protein AQ841_26440 [Burkholderia pseudomallei]OMQ65391.1 hypothetical protein AQ711_07140 [Burkholderia pseudomallei]ONA22262.1 hypothetical protein AQ877_15950 [Burkholderia pseudomallei]ONE78050.1 hypothetical protein AQ956_17055 [Burkholderia pseudomallei]